MTVQEKIKIFEDVNELSELKQLPTIDKSLRSVLKVKNIQGFDRDAILDLYYPKMRNVPIGDTALEIAAIKEIIDDLRKKL